jgi:prephenate dehydrogenase
MTGFESAAIVGLGLMGGSLARDLAHQGVRVSAFDRDAGHLAAAVRDGVVATALDASLAGVRSAELVVVAVPVDEAVRVLERIAPYATDALLVTDLGSTKARIVDAADRLGLAGRFVGSHPMTGDHRSGWSAARSGLFSGADVFLCSTRAVSSDAQSRAAALWMGVGARPVTMDAEAHDRRLAWTSHLPHMVSTALALALSRGGIERGAMGPGGRDVTRLAGSSAEMWTAIARDNATEIAAALAAAEREIGEMRGAIQRGDDVQLRQRFAEARAWFGLGG